MKTLVTIDPGLRVAGAAVFQDGRLVMAFLARNKVKPPITGPAAWWGMYEVVSTALDDPEALCFPRYDECVLERMRVYPRRKGPPPADLIEVTGASAFIGAAVGAKAYAGYFAAEWKGQVPKEIMTARIEAALTPAEVERIQKCPASLRHNVLDAIGIGLFHLGRLG